MRHVVPATFAALLLASCASGPSVRDEASVASRDVTFASHGLELLGTITLPSRLDGPAPAVVLVHGSGPNARDEVMRGQMNMGFGFDLPVFRELAEGFSNAGYVVLRFDKRSCGPFNGCADNGYPMPDPDMRLGVLLDDVS
ncbi:MAG TPA: hypothetical protein VGD74_00110, partial [Vulgatibacter sp.]